MTQAHASLLTRPVTDADATAIGGLHARVFGPGRFVRTAYRIREGTLFASSYCRAAILEGRMVASLRMKMCIRDSHRFEPDDSGA